MRKPLLWTVTGVLGIAILVVAAVLVIRSVGSSSAAVTAECTVPAVPGPSVTVVLEGPQTTGAGAAGKAAAGASATAATTVTTAPAVGLTAVQLQHAATINAVGLSRGLPERARVIALATAWQESKLRNLPAGDLDSVGLFQQRPSQGWGTAAQIADPVHAAGKFYDALVEVPGWQSMSLTKAAQEVQFSAFPDAYAQWEPAATTLARALGGADPVTLSCIADAQPPSAPSPRRPALAGTASASPALSTALAAAQAEMGGLSVVSISADGRSAVLAATIPRLPADQAARAAAAWAVGHSAGFDVTEVAVQDRRWADHRWAAGTAPAGSGRLSLTVR